MACVVLKRLKHNLLEVLLEEVIWIIKQSLSKMTFQGSAKLGIPVLHGQEVMLDHYPPNSNLFPNCNLFPFFLYITLSDYWFEWKLQSIWQPKFFAHTKMVNLTYILTVSFSEIYIIILNSWKLLKFQGCYSVSYICSSTFLLHTQSLCIISSYNSLTETLILTISLKKFPLGELSSIKILLFSLYSFTNGITVYILQRFANIHLCYIYAILLINSFL